MLLATIVETSRQVAETTRRLEKTERLAGLLKQLDPEEAEIVVSYLSGNTRQGRTGIGYATLRDAGAQLSETPSLEIREVDRSLDALANVKGRGSEQHKRELLQALFARATAAEQQFLQRLLTGELRQGALEGVMLDALAKASGIAADRIRRAVMMAGEIAPVARAALASGEHGLAGYDVQLFRPVQPMLAQTSDDVSGALTDLGEAALEYKFDGARVQVHRLGDEVAVYSRRLNNVTPAVPEIVEAVRAMPGESLILDGEVLSLAPDGRPQPFQVTMRRFGRKLDVEQMRSELPLTPFWFDLLHQ
ncbi:MAG: ATP-dependent DNA ligase, partial [bacterium]